MKFASERLKFHLCEVVKERQNHVRERQKITQPQLWRREEVKEKKNYRVYGG